MRRVKLGDVESTDENHCFDYAGLNLVRLGVNGDIVASNDARLATNGEEDFPVAEDADRKDDEKSGEKVENAVSHASCMNCLRR